MSPLVSSLSPWDSPSRAGLRQVRPPRHQRHGDGPASGGRARPGPPGPADSAGEQAASATARPARRPAPPHFKISFLFPGLSISGHKLQHWSTAVCRTTVEVHSVFFIYPHPTTVHSTEKKSSFLFSFGCVLCSVVSPGR